MHARHPQIDIVKGLLVAGMVLAHVIQLLLADPRPLKLISDMANLASFSGFYFCFGFAAWLAYWSKDAIRWAAMLRTALKCYLAFAVSGLAFKTLVAGTPLDIQLVRRVVLLRDIPGYSEFLLAFPLALVAASIFRPLLRWATENWLQLALASLACLAITFFPTPPGRDPLIALWINGLEFAYFPVLPYGPLFLYGVYAARHGLRTTLQAMMLAIAVTVYHLYRLHLGAHEHRFPPSALWILQSLAGFYAYLGLSTLLVRAQFQRPALYFMMVGRHVLLYLLCSNLLIFSIFKLGGGRTLSAGSGLLLYVGIMAACGLLHAGPGLLRRRADVVPRP